MAYAESTSWGMAAAAGGNLVEVEVGAQGAILVRSSLCPGKQVKSEVLRPDWDANVEPSPGSSLIGILSKRDGKPLFVVPDVGWTRWALQLSPVYLNSVCRVAAAEAQPAQALRPGWRDLLQKIDQRARDEASRLAFEFSIWADDLSETELTAIVQQISVFPVPEAEALRWTVFLRRVPPGPTLLALLRVSEASSKPFFKTFLKTYKQLLANDSRFIAFCRDLNLAERPEVCPPLPDRAPPERN